jgi:hypothetical protein
MRYEVYNNHKYIYKLYYFYNIFLTNNYFSWEINLNHVRNIKDFDFTY